MPERGRAADAELLLLGCAISRQLLDDLKTLRYPGLYRPDRQQLGCRIGLGFHSEWWGSRPQDELIVAVDLDARKLHFARSQLEVVQNESRCRTCRQQMPFLSRCRERVVYLGTLPLADSAIPVIHRRAKRRVTP